MSPASASVAVTAAPTSWPAAVFSAMERSTAAGSNTGALLVTGVPRDPSTLWLPFVPCSLWVRLAGRLLLDAVRMRSSESSFNVRDWSPTQMPLVSSSVACTV